MGYKEITFDETPTQMGHIGLSDFMAVSGFIRERAPGKPGGRPLIEEWRKSVTDGDLVLVIADFSNESVIQSMLAVAQTRHEIPNQIVITGKSSGLYFEPALKAA